MLSVLGSSLAMQIDRYEVNSFVVFHLQKVLSLLPSLRYNADTTLLSSDHLFIIRWDCIRN